MALARIGPKPRNCDHPHTRTLAYKTTTVRACRTCGQVWVNDEPTTRIPVHPGIHRTRTGTGRDWTTSRFYQHVRDHLQAHVDGPLPQDAVPDYRCTGCEALWSRPGLCPACTEANPRRH